MLFFTIFCSIVVALVVKEPALKTPTRKAFSSNINDFKLISKYAAASYCKQIYENKTWTCGRACGNMTAGTVFVDYSIDNITTSAGYFFHSYSYVAYNSNLKSIFISFRGTVSWQGALVDANFYFSPADWKYKPQNILSVNDILPSNLNVLKI